MIDKLQPIIHKPLAFIVKDFKTATSYRLNFLMQFFGIFFNLTVFYMVARLVNAQSIEALESYGGQYFPFLLVGLAFSDYFSISTGAFATQIRSAQVMGTLESLLATPTSYQTILFSSFLYQLLYTSLRVFIYLLIGTFIYGAHLSLQHPFLLLSTFILTLLPFIGLGLLSAAFIIVLKQGSPISYVVTISSSLFGGVLYPVSVLPDIVQPIAQILPITHGLEAMRQIMLNNAAFEQVYNQLIILGIFAVICLTAGTASVLYSLNLAKKEGSLFTY